MVSTGQWEVVVRKPKKAKQDKDILANGKLSKSGKKKFMENAPKLSDLPPSKERGAAFLGGLTGEVKMVSPKPTSQPNTEKKNKKAEKKQPAPPPKRPKNLSEAFSALRETEITYLIETMKLNFKSTPKMWLKELSLFLSTCLNFTEKDMREVGHPDYPWHLLPQNIQNAIVNVIKECSDATIIEFFEDCVVGLVDDMAKGAPYMGHKLMGQAVARDRPLACASVAAKLGELRSSYQSKPNVCVWLLWLGSEPGRWDVSAGIKVWFDLMAPVLGMKAYWTRSISYITELFNRDLELVQCNISAQQFFHLLDFTFQPTPILPAKLHQQLLDLYPKIRTAVFCSHSNSSKHYFPSFLRRLQPSVHHQLKQELLINLESCLTCDPQCFASWSQLFPQYIPQTQILLADIKKKYSSLVGTFDSNSFETMLRSFIRKGEQLIPHTKGLALTPLHASIRISKELLNELRRPFQFPWRLINFVLFLLCAGLLVQDIYQHNGFKDTRTRKFLHSSGIVKGSEIILNNTKVYSQKGLNYIMELSPEYWNAAKDIVAPYAEVAGAGILWATKQIILFTHEAAEYVRDGYPKLLLWVEEKFPGWQDKCREAINTCIEWLKPHVEYIYESVAQIVQHSISYWFSS